mmetsp:Transcript_42862/g.97736  ORF Transcript_42862/g.97736 Transcript_42862/m.97736 type:complete len:209 (-) Transcript_42862:517-1143(-)
MVFIKDLLRAVDGDSILSSRAPGQVSKRVQESPAGSVLVVLGVHVAESLQLALGYLLRFGAQLGRLDAGLQLAQLVLLLFLLFLFFLFGIRRLGLLLHCLLQFLLELGNLPSDGELTHLPLGTLLQASSHFLGHLLRLLRRCHQVVHKFQALPLVHFLQHCLKLRNRRSLQAGCNHIGSHTSRAGQSVVLPVPKQPRENPWGVPLSIA